MTKYFKYIVVFNHLDMDILSLQMKVKVWEYEHELVLPFFTKQENKKVIESTDQHASKDPIDDAERSRSHSKLENSSVP